MKIKLSATVAALLLSMYLLCVFNIGYWQEVVAAVPFSASGVVFVVVMFIAFWAAMFVIMSFLMLPYLHKVFIPFILIAGSAVAYTSMAMGVYFNGDMLRNVLQTNPGEAKALLSWSYVLWIVFTGIVPAVCYLKFIQIRYRSRWYWEIALRVGSMIVGLLLFAGLAYGFYNDFAPFFRNHKPIVHKLNPTNFLGASIKMSYGALKGKTPFQLIGQDAVQLPAKHSDAKPKVLVLVVGETTRAQNWGLDGYMRQTTPQLAAMGDVVNFPKAVSCGTSTAISVPCMFSVMSRTEYDEDKATNQSNLMDILKKAGIGTFWRENDGGCKGVCDRIEHQDIKDVIDPKLCTFEGCLDMGLLQNLPDYLQQISHDAVIVLHSMGSHGPAYYQRYPSEFRRFTPTCDTNQIQSCSHEQLVNSYDNGVLYIDHILAETINLLKNNQNIDSALWYLSDHGESLGERGLYLHAAPYAIAPEEQTHIPMIFWASDGFARDSDLDMTCLNQKAQSEQASHDNLFPSVLGLFDVQTSVYRPESDFFKSCRSLNR